MVKVRLPSIVDFFTACDDAGAARPRLDRRQVARMAGQIVGGGAVAVTDEADALCLVAGLIPMEDAKDCAQLWFLPGPALRANLIAALRAGEVLLKAVGADNAPLQVFAFVEAGRVAGRRMAAGFSFEEIGQVKDDYGRPITVWRRRF